MSAIAHDPRQARRSGANADVTDAIALCRDLKRRGFTFVGLTTVYAFMQAMGLVNDHIEGCHCRAEVAKMRRK